MKKHLGSGERGFTLIELLIVTVIIGILAAVAIPKFSATRDKAYRSTMMADLRNLASAQEIFYNDGLTFGDDLAALDVVESTGVTITISEATSRGWAATAVHLGVPGGQCGVFHGDAAAAGGDPATTQSVIACSF
jgi:type IV pilus assembly protein PilA